MRLILALCLLTFLGLSCEKKKLEPGENRLPWRTNYGRDMFACHIDGMTYISKRQSTKAKYNNESGYLFIESNLVDTEQNQMVLFRFFIYEGVFATGNYALDSTGEEVIMDDYLNGRYALLNGGANSLVINKLRPDREVVSGTFEMDLVNVIDSNQIEIRDGRFDLSLEVIF